MGRQHVPTDLSSQSQKTTYRFRRAGMPAFFLQARSCDAREVDQPHFLVTARQPFARRVFGNWVFGKFATRRFLAEEMHSFHGSPPRRRHEGWPTAVATTTELKALVRMERRIVTELTKPSRLTDRVPAARAAKRPAQVVEPRILGKPINPALPNPLR